MAAASLAGFSPDISGSGGTVTARAEAADWAFWRWESKGWPWALAMAARESERARRQTRTGEGDWAERMAAAREARVRRVMDMSVAHLGMAGGRDTD